MPRQSSNMRGSISADVTAATALLVQLQDQVRDTTDAMATAGQAAADSVGTTAAALQTANQASTAAQLQQLQTLTTAQQNALSQIAGFGGQEAAQSARQMEAMLAPVGTAVSRSVASVIQGRTTAQQALARIGQSVLADEVSSNARRLTQWVATEAAKTASTTAGTATRTAAEQAGQTAGDADLAANAVRAITTDAAQSFGGVFAFLAPELGPAAAGPAAAAQASVLSVAGGIASAAGGWDRVPADGMLAQLHKNEMVLPASIASPLRQSIGSLGGSLGGGGSHSFHYAPTIHLNASRMSRGEVETMLRDHGGVFAKHVQNTLRNGGGR